MGARAPGDSDQGRGQAGGAGHQRGRGVRRPVRAGVAGGLPGRLEPRAADRGTARHTSGLSVFPFLRLVNVIECDRQALADTAPLIDALGGAENLAAHVAAVRVRVPRGTGQVP